MGHGSNNCEHDLDASNCHVCRDETIQAQDIHIEKLNAVAIAARTVLRNALDQVDAHPCDAFNDQVKAQGLSVEMKALYDVLTVFDSNEIVNGN